MALENEGRMDGRPTVSISELVKARWFTRGWTLQELLALKQVQFYAASWIFIEDKTHLLDHVTRSTGVHRSVLEGSQPFDRSVAHRMSWALKSENN
jgi:hypothetical protein